MHTDGNSHDLSYFDGQEEYTKVEVTEDTYAEQAAEGLYFFQGAYTVPSGVEKIVFRYYDEEGNILESDTVPVLSNGEKGDTGPAGEKGSAYRGAASSYTSFTDWVKGDFYLNSTDGYIYRYDYPDKSGEEAFSQLSYADNPAYYSQAMVDGINYFKSIGEGTPLATAISTWTENLVAINAFITNLFTKNIVVQGSIQSSDWTGDDSEAGFYMDRNKLQCVNGLFKGEIESGPLLLRATDPISNIEIEAGTKVYDAFQTLESKGVMPGGTNTVSGTFNGVEVTTFSMSTSTSSTTYGDQFRYKSDDYTYQKYIGGDLYDISVYAYHRTVTNTYTITINYGDNSISCTCYETYTQRRYHEFYYDKSESYVDYKWTEWTTISDITTSCSSETLTGDTDISFSAGKKTLRLTDLPQAASSTAGIVYQDNDGFLRISL